MSEREDTGWMDAGWGPKYQTASEGKHEGGPPDGAALSQEPAKAPEPKRAERDGPSWCSESSAKGPDYGF